MVSRYFPAWYLGVFPDRRIILASYEADFAASWGRKARTLLEEWGPAFGVRVASDSSAANRWDLQGQDGGMVTAGVGGPITGKGAHLLVIDDPIKNYEEAHSETYRERTWDWYTSTAFTRLEPGGTVIVIQTRWHSDDLAGRILERLTHEPWTEIRFPALAEEADPLGRAPGEALWPDRFDKPALERIRKTLGSYQFSALYQQRPTPMEGGFFKRSWLPVLEAAPVKWQRIVRGWDKAATEKGGDWSAGVLCGQDMDGYYWILDVIRGQWSSGERNRVMEQTAALDAQRWGRVEIWIEQEPGSGGKESAEYTVKMLAGYSIFAEKVTGDKEVRAQPLAAQAEAGNVRLLRGDWSREFIEELCTFPHGTHDDQVDAASLAFNKAALGRKRQLRWLTAGE